MCNRNVYKMPEIERTKGLMIFFVVIVTALKYSRSRVESLLLLSFILSTPYDNGDFT